LTNLTSLVGGSFTVQNGAGVELPNLTSVNSSSLHANSGATLLLPNVASYSKGGGDAYFQSNGVGSAISLPGLTSLSGEGDWLRVYARAGGLIGLPYLASITNSYVNLSADGTGTGGVASTVDLSALTSFSDTNGIYGYLSATNGGRVIDPLLTAPSGLSITVGTSGATTLSQMNTGQLTSMVRGGISVYQAADLSGLTTLTNSGLGIASALNVSLPGLTNINGSSLSADAGSVISLPNVASYSKGGETPTSSPTAWQRDQLAGIDEPFRRRRLAACLCPGGRPDRSSVLGQYHEQLRQSIGRRYGDRGRCEHGRSLGAHQL